MALSTLAGASNKYSRGCFFNISIRFDFETDPPSGFANHTYYCVNRTASAGGSAVSSASGAGRGTNWREGFRVIDCVKFKWRAAGGKRITVRVTSRLRTRQFGRLASSSANDLILAQLRATLTHITSEIRTVTRSVF